MERKTERHDQSNSWKGSDSFVIEESMKSHTEWMEVSFSAQANEKQQLTYSLIEGVNCDLRRPYLEYSFFLREYLSVHVSTTKNHLLKNDTVVTIDKYIEIDFDHKLRQFPPFSLIKPFTNNIYVINNF